MAIIVPKTPCLVWVISNGRLSAEKWGPDTIGTAEKVAVDYHELRPGEVGMAIAILEQRYPARNSETAP